MCGEENDHPQRSSPWLSLLQETNANAQSPVEERKHYVPYPMCPARRRLCMVLKLNYNETSFTRAQLLTV